MQPIPGFPTSFNPDVSTQLGMSQNGPDEAVLYVGNLSNLVTDAILHQHFQNYGKIANVAIKKNTYTGESRGFAFVNFFSVDDARKAKEALNHTDILGREIRICFKKDHKTVDPEANVYIKNLGENVRGKQVEEEFSPFGAIFSCTVKYDENGKHLGYGYVQFKEKEAAANAIQKLDGTNLLGSKISVQKFIPRGKRNIMNWKTNLYVKGFPKDWNKAKVEQFINDKFKPIGTTSSICIVENPKLGRCFAFVAFEKDEKAAEAIKSFNDIQVGNETLYVGYAQKKTERRRKLAEEFAKQTNETNLFIKSLREDVTEETLKQIFSAYGEITSVAVQESTRIPKSIESHGVKLKFGFINFKSDACAKKAFIEAKKSPEVKKLISEFHNDSKDFLYFAQPKSVREQYLKMVRKNLQSTTMLQTQMNMFKMMMQQMNSNKKMFPAAQKRGGKAGAQPAAAPGVVNPGMMPMMGQAGMDGSTVPMMNMEFMNFVRHPMMMMPGMGMPGFNPAQFTGTPAVPIQQPQIAVPAAPAKAETMDITWLINNQKKFEQMSSDEKRKFLGNLMYYRVASQQNVSKELVPKITGMLIDLEVLELSDIIEILKNDDALKERIADAINIINDNDQ